MNLIKDINLTINLIFVLKALLNNLKFKKTYFNNYSLNYKFFLNNFLLKLYF